MVERLNTALADRYRIERELGAGGMATVYLAEDLRHDRKVALKVLKPELTAVLGGERFVQEIKTTAQLQHPHILPLFDSGTADGFLFYVMPYIEGETLRDKLDREAQLGVEEAVRIAREVADALDYAHRAGIIHRDIKPENILLHDGRPMVADFGIALAVSAAAGGRMTETGTSIGTPHYMSPEQATADREITGRADIYSLASVLYEMLTGEPPHTGSTAQAVIMKIIADTPRPVSELRKSVPPNVAAAVMMALEKLPADRFGSAKAFADALADPHFSTGTAARAASDASGVFARRPALTYGLVAVLAVAALWGWLRPTHTPAPTRERVLLQTRQGPNAVALGSAIAPDGSAIVYADTIGGKVRLWIKERGVLEPRPLAPFSGRSPPVPAFSPDGQWIVYASNDKLERVARQGGPPVQLADSAGSGGAAWLDDGTIVVSDGGSIYAIPAGGGPARRVYRTSATILKVAPVPRARAVLVSAIAGTVNAFALDLDTDSVRDLGVDAAAAWVVGETLVYATSAGRLLAAPFDARRLGVRGPPMSILQGIRVDRGLPEATVGRDGTILYSEGGAARAGEQVKIASVARDGGVDTTWTVGSNLFLNWSIALSQDGSRLALSVVDSTTGNSNLFLIRLADGTWTRLTFTGTQNFQPAWSPDETTILYVSDAGGQPGLWTKRADGSGEAMPVQLPESRSVFDGAWSPDGSWLVYRTDTGAEGNADILAVRTRGDTTPAPLVASGALEVSPAISPDGRWLMYASDESGRSEIYVRPFPNTSTGMWQVSTDGGMEPRWSHSGQEIFYRNADGELVAVAVSDGPTFTTGAHTTLFDAGRYSANPVSRTYAVTPDGRHFLFLEPLSEPQADGGGLVLMRNWLPAVRTGAASR